MTGKVIQVLCNPGDEVAAGTPLVVVEAMKMEHRLSAAAPARVLGVEVVAGDQVDMGQELVRLEPLE
jgi:biotin carboxyl carrier protein